MTLPTIHIGSKFDAKGFKQAETAIGRLNKNVKNLAGTFGLAFGTAAVVSFGKAALKAFQEDEAAATRLARAVDNLGIGFANPQISEFISNLEKSAAIADDILRPAFQGLLTTTGSLTQSQKLLNDAITISRASGIDLATVASDLGKGYVGVTKGLLKYNTGLTKAELSTKSFSEILQVLLTQSAGAAQDYLSTTAYKMDVLSVAGSNAAEIIGGGLVDAFAIMAGGSEASDAAKLIEQVANAIADLERFTGGAIAAIPNLITLLKNLPKNIFLGFVGAQTGINVSPKPTVVKPKKDLTKEAQAKLLAKLEADALKRQRDLAALTKKQLLDTQKRLLLDKAKDALTKAAAQFDIKQITIAAALKNTYDQDTRLRLLAMQAIESDNGEKAIDYLNQLGILQKAVQTDKLNGLTTVSNAQLVALNTVLLAEIDGINKSDMLEKDKQQARLQAFAKYNDAITKQGGLAALNSYDELRQIEVNKIAKIAALDDVGAASATLQLILNSDVAALATAQSDADKAKYQALADYITLLGVAKNEAGLAADAAYAAEVKANIQKFQAQADYMSLLTQQENEALAGVLYVESAQANADENKNVALKDYILLLADAQSAALAVAAAVASIPAVITTPTPGTGSTAPIVPDYSGGGGLGGINLNPARANEGYASTNITVNTGPLLGTDETVQAAVQAAIQSLNRQGANTSYAGAI